MKKAFTLLELVFVIVIIGLLAAVAVPKFLTTRQNAILKQINLIVNEMEKKVFERATQIQDLNLSYVCNYDTDIHKSLNAITHMDKHFIWDVKTKSISDQTFAIAYVPKKQITGNVYYGQSNKPDGTPIDTLNTSIEWHSSTGPSKRYYGATECFKINVKPFQIPVTSEDNATGYKLVVYGFKRGTNCHRETLNSVEEVDWGCCMKPSDKYE